MEYEMVREIQNMCPNNQMRDIFFDEVQTDDPERYVRTFLEGKAVDEATIHGSTVYFAVYFAFFFIFLLLLSLEPFDFESTFTAVTACFNNIGPGLEAVGPTCNFGGLTVFSKWVLSFAMLAGRLELFPMLMLFHPTLWREGFFGRKAGRG